MRFTTRLRGEVVTSMPASTSREGNLSGEKGEAPKDEQHRHQLLLDSPVIEMTYLGKRARTLDDPVSNPFRQTYLLPKRALCSCGSTLLLPSSCADGRVQIRYWFEIVGQRLNSSESRLRWKGKNRLPDMDERHSAKVLAIPVRITAERYSPRYIPSPDDLAMAGTSRNEPPVSVSQRGDETLTTRYFLEDERPKLAGFDVSSLKVGISLLRLILPLLHRADSLTPSWCIESRLLTKAPLLCTSAWRSRSEYIKTVRGTESYATRSPRLI